MEFVLYSPSCCGIPCRPTWRWMRRGLLAVAPFWTRCRMGPWDSPYPLARGWTFSFLFRPVGCRPAFPPSSSTCITTNDVHFRILTVTHLNQIFEHFLSNLNEVEGDNLAQRRKIIHLVSNLSNLFTICCWNSCRNFPKSASCLGSRIGRPISPLPESSNGSSRSWSSSWKSKSKIS